ncbi:phosphatidate cytidylyltransferase [Mucilaginibacter sp. McL0603]|uniref:phosphatidate cytidylyltransferase n=1 Tax=Mucilaginibacter sp. McL0603 TaxID=3415670 RepID=UPI003CEC6213
MKTRAITGFFFVIIMVGSTLLGPHTFDIFYLVLSILCLFEFYRLVKQDEIKPSLILGLITGILLYAIFTILAIDNSDPPRNHLLLALVPCFAGIFIQELFRKSPSPFTNIAYTVFGLLFTIIPFCFFNALAYLNMYKGFNFHIPLAFLIMLWANDTGAYLSGYFFGRTKLFERHSPKKTWEGFIGGVLISALAAYIISRYYHDLSWDHWVTIAVLISCFGTLGDLVESMFKRSINIKDSGGILPGHGGLLDRFDGLLLSAPIVYAYLYLITNS